MTIDIRFWNPTSERIWWVKHVIFLPFWLFCPFLGLHFRCRSLRPKTIFFMALFLLKVLFLMTIDLRFWNPISERIWWVKHVNFYHFDFFALFSVYTSDVNPYAQKPFFFRLYFLLKVPFLMTIDLRLWNPASERIWWVKYVNFDQFNFFAHIRSKLSMLILTSKNQFFRGLFPSKGSILIDNRSKILKSEHWTYMMG